MENIEKIMKFCSKLNDVFEHPYFFNWSTPTNHVDNTPAGEIRDVNDVIFRVGKYVTNDRTEPIQKQLFFGYVSLITSFTPFNLILDEHDIKIQSFDDLIKYKEELKSKIDGFLCPTKNEIYK